MEHFFKIENGKRISNPRNKGKSLNEFPTDFCVLDLETTGLDPYFDEIIEVGIIKVRNNEIIDTYQSLIKPESTFTVDGKECYIDEFIVELTGITNEMLKEAPLLKNVFKDIENFIGDDVIVGHNINFDINFLYDFARENGFKEVNNDYWDSMKLARRILRDLKHHRLKDLAEFFDINYEGHRSLNDCETTLNIMKLLKIYADDNNIDYLTLPHIYNADMKNIKCTVENIDVNNYFYEKHICFTGKLETFERKDAAQICVNLGAICDNNVTKKTNILVLGNFDYNATIKDKSTKLKKAEKLILEGQDLIIMNESLFLNTISEND
ncbi:DNA polymerase-3 subunit epsilon [Peptoniphilus olsenii]|uniref:DNA polymerase-3 subunit epsilon n=1 Tax=Peptoniphilus olsenii TaxID=411570 RepID=A0ABV2J7L2_9FIRM